MEKKKEQNVWGYVLGAVIFAASYAIVRFLGAAIFVFIIPALIGWYTAVLYIKKNKTEGKFSRFLAWSNVITWFIPVIGILTSSAAIRFNKDYGKDDKKYFILGLIGFLLSLGNGLLGAYLKTR